MRNVFIDTYINNNINDYDTASEFMHNLCFLSNQEDSWEILKINFNPFYLHPYVFIFALLQHGDTLSNVVIVQFSENVQTSHDLAYNMTCTIRQPQDITVTSATLGAG